MPAVSEILYCRMGGGDNLSDLTLCLLQKPLEAIQRPT